MRRVGRRTLLFWALLGGAVLGMVQFPALGAQFAVVVAAPIGVLEWTARARATGYYKIGAFSRALLITAAIMVMTLPFWPVVMFGRRQTKRRLNRTSQWTEEWTSSAPDRSVGKAVAMAGSAATVAFVACVILAGFYPAAAFPVSVLTLPLMGIIVGSLLYGALALLSIVPAIGRRLPRRRRAKAAVLLIAGTILFTIFFAQRALAPAALHLIPTTLRVALLAVFVGLAAWTWRTDRQLTRDIRRFVGVAPSLLIGLALAGAIGFFAYLRTDLVSVHEAALEMVAGGSFVSLILGGASVAIESFWKRGTKKTSALIRAAK